MTEHAVRATAVKIVAEGQAVLRIEAAGILEDASSTVLEAANAAEALNPFLEYDDIGLLD